MAIHKDVMEASRIVGLPNAAHFLYNPRFTDVGYIENDGTHVGIRSALSELDRLHIVGSVLMLKIPAIHRPALMKILILDAPLR